MRKGEETVFFQPLRRGIVHGYSVSPTDDQICYGTLAGDLILADIAEDGSVTEKGLLSGGVNFSSWTPDGRTLVVSWKGPNKDVHQLYTIDLDDVDKIEVADDPLAPFENVPVTRIEGQDPTKECAQPNLSRDGKQIVFAMTVTVPKNE